MKHNNVIPNAHFRKQWARYVRTWFDQPAQKVKRRVAREAKAKRVAPRPVELLRPGVRGQTVKYNRKVRAGRGFTAAELKKAGFNVKAARGLGIAVDHRRRNKSEEGFAANVKRLDKYKSKLVVFPRKSHKKITKKGDSTADQRKAVAQVSLCEAMPITTPKIRSKARKITDKEREVNVAAVLRKALTDGKLWGARAKREKDKAEAAKAPKAAAVDAGGDDGGD